MIIARYKIFWSINEISVLIYMIFFDKIACLVIIALAIQAIFTILDVLAEIAWSIYVILAIFVLDIVTWFILS